MEQIESGTSTVFIYKENDMVIKRIHKSWSTVSYEQLFRNEVGWLNVVGIFKGFPSLKSFESEGFSIFTNYCGERLSKQNAPSNINTQIESILYTLQYCGCSHNDIKPEDLLVLDGVLTLVDFGWANDFGVTIPKHWPPHLGNEFKAESDRGSFDKVLEWLEKQ